VVSVQYSVSACNFIHSSGGCDFNIQFYFGSLPDLISNLKNQEGKYIYCDGGAETVHQLLQNDLFDELIIPIIPVLLGDGIRLFKGGIQEQKLQLINAKSFEKRLVQLRYIRVWDFSYSCCDIIYLPVPSHNEQFSNGFQQEFVLHAVPSIQQLIRA